MERKSGASLTDCWALPADWSRLGPLGPPLEPLPPLFHSLSLEHFDGALKRGGVPLVTLRWSNGHMSRTAGFYRRGKRRDGRELCEIVLSRPLLEPLPSEALLSTLCHGMIHAWVDRLLGVNEAHRPHFPGPHAGYQLQSGGLSGERAASLKFAAGGGGALGGLPPLLQSLSRGALAPQLPTLLRAGRWGHPVIAAMSATGWFLWTLEVGGIAISVLGIQRERWLQTRRR